MSDQPVDSPEIPQEQVDKSVAPLKSMFDRWAQNPSEQRDIQKEVQDKFAQKGTIKSTEGSGIELSEGEAQRILTEKYLTLLKERNTPENQRKFNDVMAIYFTNPDIELTIKGYDAGGKLIEDPMVTPSTIEVDSEGRKGAEDENRRMRQRFLNGTELPEYFLLDGRKLTRVSNVYIIDTSNSQIEMVERLIVGTRPIDGAAVDMANLENYSKWTIQKIMGSPLGDENELQGQPVNLPDYEILNSYLTSIDKGELVQA